VLDLSGILPIRTEYNGTRFWAYFPKEKAQQILESYDGGTLKVFARDFEAALVRVKNKVFESERLERARANHETRQPR
jgi:hypothetical protein